MAKLAPFVKMSNFEEQFTFFSLNESFWLHQIDRNPLRAEKVQDFETPFSDFDPRLPPNGGFEGGNNMTK